MCIKSKIKDYNEKKKRVDFFSCLYSLKASHVSRDIGISTQQDLGLARLGALGALTELNENSDLLNDVPSTINYEDLGLGGGSISTQHSGSSRHQVIFEE